MTTFFIVTIIVIVLFITLYVIKVKPEEKPKSIFDVLNEDPQIQKMKGIYDILSEINKDGTDLDTIPDGYGEFGYEVTNPIPVNTVFGIGAYLGKLRTLDGKKVQYERLGSISAPNLKDLIDIYEILVDNKKITTLYISSEHKRNSERPPKGFKLVALP